MLIGRYDNSIDAKGRMIVPAKFRHDLGDSCFLSLGLDGCLCVYPEHEWKSYAAKLNELPHADENARRFRRQFFSNSEECTIDKQGRLMIPQKFREIAHLEKDLVTLGVQDKMEIWSKEVYEKEDDEMLPPEQLAEKIKEYGKV